MNFRGILTIMVLAIATIGYTQEAEFTTEPVFAKFVGDAPTYLTIISPPNLEQDKSRGFTKIKGSKVDVEGKVTDNNGVKSLIVNDFLVDVALDGSFSKEIPLVAGENSLLFAVTDNNENKLEKSYTIVSESDDVIAGIAGVGKYYALLIGINEYDDPEIIDLDKPIEDAEALADALTNYYVFDPQNVVMLKDASRTQIIDALDNLRERVTDDDNLLIFYAGHGLWDESAEIGYWIPSDGSKNSTSGYFRKQHPI